MSQNWIAEPQTLYSLLTIGLSLSLYLLVSLKRDLRRLEARRRREREAGEASLAQLRGALDELRGRVEQLELPPGWREGSWPPPAAMNLTKRTQVLRMHRRGFRPEQIAAALALPQNEVDLLIKVQATLLSEPWGSRAPDQDPVETAVHSGAAR